MLPRCRSPWQWRTRPARRRCSSRSRFRSSSARLRRFSVRDRWTGQDRIGQARQILDIALDDLAHAGVAAALRPLLGPVVEAGDRLGERVDRRGIERAALGDPVQQQVLIEACHLEQPFDRLAVALQRIAAIRAPGHR